MVIDLVLAACAGGGARQRSVLAAVWVGIVLLLAACAPPILPGRVSTQHIIIGEDQLIAQNTMLTTQPALPRTQAVAIAQRYVPTWQQASAITARHVALTLRTSSGQVAWGVQNRAVWLVEFTGTRYAPVAYPESACVCDRSFQPPNTAVAVDAQTGVLVIDYGFAHDGTR